MMRRWRNLPVARRRRADPPWVVTQAPPAPVPPAFVSGTARWVPVVRRGRFLAVPAVLPLVPSVARRRPMLWSAAHRGRFQPVPSTADTPIVAWRRRALVGVTARRGDFFPAPFPTVVPAGPGPVPPSMRRAPHATALIRRPSLFAEPVWPQQAPPAPPPFVPRATRPPARLLQPRRGHYQQTPPLDLTVPPRWRRRPPIVLGIRRGEFGAVPLQIPVPPRSRRRATPLLTVRRGEFFIFVPAQVPPPPPPAMAPGRLSRRRQLTGIRRGRFAPVVEAQDGQPISRDITITYGRLKTGWSTGELANGWATGRPGSNWTTGQLEV